MNVNEPVIKGPVIKSFKTIVGKKQCKIIRFCNCDAINFYKRAYYYNSNRKIYEGPIFLFAKIAKRKRPSAVNRKPFL